MTRAGARRRRGRSRTGRGRSARGSRRARARRAAARARTDSIARANGGRHGGAGRGFGHVCRLGFPARAAPRCHAARGGAGGRRACARRDVAGADRASASRCGSCSALRRRSRRGGRRAERHRRPHRDHPAVAARRRRRASSSLDLDRRDRSCCRRRPTRVLPGEYSFWFAGDTGHARVGEIIATGSRGRVTRAAARRRLRRPRARARRGRFSGWFYLSPRDLGLAVRRTSQIADAARPGAGLVRAGRRGPTRPLGDPGARPRRAPAGDAARRSRRSATPAITSLIVSLPQRRRRAAQRRLPLRARRPRVARRRGGDALRPRPRRDELVLMGWSMGGATVLQALTRSPLAGARDRASCSSRRSSTGSRRSTSRRELRRLPAPVRCGVLHADPAALGRHLHRPRRAARPRAPRLRAPRRASSTCRS